MSHECQKIKTEPNFYVADNKGYRLPWWLRGLSICLNAGDPVFDLWVGKIPWRRKWQSTPVRIPWKRKWQPTPVFLPGESHGQRSLVGYSPQGRKESDTTERLHFHFHFMDQLIMQSDCEIPTAPKGIKAPNQCLTFFFSYSKDQTHLNSVGLQGYQGESPRKLSLSWFLPQRDETLPLVCPEPWEQAGIRGPFSWPSEGR